MEFPSQSETENMEMNVNDKSCNELGSKKYKILISTKVIMYLTYHLKGVILK